MDHNSSKLLLFFFQRLPTFEMTEVAHSIRLHKEVSPSKPPTEVQTMLRLRSSKPRRPWCKQSDQARSQFKMGFLWPQQLHIRRKKLWVRGTQVQVLSQLLMTSMASSSYWLTKAEKNTLTRI